MMKKESLLQKLSHYYAIVGAVVLIVAIVLIVIPFGPYIIYRINPSETENEVTKITTPLVASGETLDVKDNTNTLPEVDTSLPIQPYIKMEKIGVYSPISTISDYTTALKDGAWMVPDYGTPTNGMSPIIIAAHRFGYIYWDSATRKKISFFNLPQMHIGDTVQIIWDQRLFTYQIYAEDENTYITDYSANLILYTCKYLDSPVRIFRYAKLVTNE